MSFPCIFIDHIKLFADQTSQISLDCLSSKFKNCRSISHKLFAHASISMNALHMVPQACTTYFITSFCTSYVYFLHISRTIGLTKCEVCRFFCTPALHFVDTQNRIAKTKSMCEKMPGALGKAMLFNGGPLKYSNGCEGKRTQGNNVKPKVSNITQLKRFSHMINSMRKCDKNIIAFDKSLGILYQKDIMGTRKFNQ